jgi:hypothetical protein
MKKPEHRERLEASDLQGFRCLAGEMTHHQGELLWGMLNVTPRNEWSPRCADEGLPDQPASKGKKRKPTLTIKMDLQSYVKNTVR